MINRQFGGIVPLKPIGGIVGGSPSRNSQDVDASNQYKLQQDAKVQAVIDKLAKENEEKNKRG